MEPDRILVIGDAMIDVHCFGSSERLSPEAPVPVISVEKETTTLGGAANVAAHIVSAGIRTTFAFKNFTSNTHHAFGTLCFTRGIMTEPLEFPERHPFTTKKRIWCGKQQICRLDSENAAMPDHSTILQWFRKIVSITENDNIKIILMSDYNKGTLPDELIQMVANYAKECGIKTILDPKRPSFCKLKNLFIVKPNNKELSSTNLTAAECSKAMNDTYLIHTKGKDGMSIYQNGEVVFECPTVAKEVFDVTGCGDSVSALLAISLFQDRDVKQAAIAANKAASFTITHLGCYVLTQDEIKECLEVAHGSQSNS